LRRLPEVRLPPARRWPWIAFAASIAVHALFLFIRIQGSQPVLPHRPPELIVLSPPAEGPTAAPMPYRVPRAEGRAGTGPAGVRPSRPVIRPRPQAVAELPPPRPKPVRPDSGSAPVPPQLPKARPAIGRIGPELADGQLWVRPLPLPPRELAQRLTKEHVQLVDSAVTAIVQAYLDSIANDPSAHSQGLPSWTKEIAGRKFGLDSQHIYIAGLKIPAAVLALLPIGQGNVDQNRAYNHLMDLRADLMYAAQRADNLEEFKERIREMRLRKEQEEEFEKNQRTAPAPADTATP